MATQSSTLAWRIPWAEEPGRLQPMGSQTPLGPCSILFSPLSSNLTTPHPSHSDCVLLDYTPENTLCSCLEQISPCFPFALDHRARLTGKSVLIIQWLDAPKSWVGCLPSRSSLLATRRRCTLSCLHGLRALRCPAGLAGWSIVSGLCVPSFPAQPAPNLISVIYT